MRQRNAVSKEILFDQQAAANESLIAELAYRIGQLSSPKDLRGVWLWHRLKAAIKGRSPETVARMERDRGLG